MSTQFTQWQRLSAAKTNDKQALERARAAAIAHMDFVVLLYEEQVAGGRYFLHQHPRHADSWDLKSVRRLRSTPGVEFVHGDQRQFDVQIQHGTFEGHLTNSTKLGEALAVRCEGQGGACSRLDGGQRCPLNGQPSIPEGYAEL